jgi:molecular chaperone DnaK
MEPKGYIGIDFGTTNSHFAYARLDQDPAQAIPILLNGAEGGSLSSCVLWKAPGCTEEDFYLYGDAAIEEWIMLDPQDQSAYRFSAGFKPDIVSLPQARLDAWAFLRQAYQDMRKTRQPAAIGDENGMPVVIGVPAQIGEAYHQIALEIAAKAGFGQATCIAEPLGALAYHLAYGHVTAEEVKKGVVVVDFGGGTLDVALLDQQGIREPWGDPLLGGRLFDDLFFQWLIEANSVDVTAFSTDELLYGWHVGCRKLKERFSKHWKTRGADKTFEDFRGRAEVAEGQTLGVLRNASLDEFMARARAYRPSAVAKDYFQRLGSDLRHLGETGPVDLIGQIQQAIASGPELREHRDFAVIILTGGSSSWPFMVPMVSHLFGVKTEAILLSAAPERTIGEGLAMYPVIRQRHRQAQDRIELDRSHLTTRLFESIHTATVTAAQSLSADITQQVIEIARAHYERWRHHGGALTGVEAQVKAACEKIPIDAMVQERLSRLAAELRDVAINTTLHWLERHGVKNTAMEAGVITRKPLATFAVKIEFDVSAVVGEQITHLLGAISALIVATISGGSGMALIASGPAGLLIGAIIGAAAVYAGQDVIRQKVSEYAFDGATLSMMQLLFSKDKLNQVLRESEQTLAHALQQKMIDEMQAYRTQFERYANSAAEDALRHFGILDRLS